MTLQQVSWQYCRTVVRRSGSSFASAFGFLPREKRNAMIVLYAFMRLTDDWADDSTCSFAGRQERLTRWRSLVERMFDDSDNHEAQTESLAPRQTAAQEQVFPSLKQVCQQFQIPRESLLDVVEGVVCDLMPQVRMNTLDDALLYCDRVAGAVGRATLAVFGCDVPLDLPEINKAILACGRAFQWTNFLRDIGEDLKTDRVYFPLADFLSCGLSLETFKSVPAHDNANAIEFFRIQNERTNRFYEESELLLDHVNRDCRDVYNLMRRRYRLLFDKLQTDNFQAFCKRIRLSPWNKTKLLVPCFLSRLTGR